MIWHVLIVMIASVYFGFKLLAFTFKLIVKAWMWLFGKILGIENPY